MKSKLIYTLILIVTISGCYTQKKAEKELNKAYLNYEDLVAKKTRVWFPCITNKVKTDTIYKPANDSSKYYQQKADSLLLIKRNIKDSLAIRYKDSCRAVQDNYAYGFNLGYEVGVYDGMRKCVPDTLYIPSISYIEDSAKIKNYQSLNEKLQDENKELSRKNKVKGKWNLILAGVSLLLIIIIYVVYKMVMATKNKAK